MELTAVEKSRELRSSMSSVQNTFHLAQRLSISLRPSELSRAEEKSDAPPEPIDPAMEDVSESFDASKLRPFERKISSTILPRTAELEANGWKCVRHCRSGGIWHRATDNLQGKQIYGDHHWGDHPKAPHWSIPFGNDFDEILFSTGDGEKWLVIDKKSIIGRESLCSSANPGTMLPLLESTSVLRSSLDPCPHELLWMFGSGDPKIPAPWVTLENFNRSQADDGAGFLYGENSFSVLPPANAATNKQPNEASSESQFGRRNLKQHGGANVYVKIAGKVSHDV